jgi:hypothetical protein
MTDSNDRLAEPASDAVGSDVRTPDMSGRTGQEEPAEVTAAGSSPYLTREYVSVGAGPSVSDEDYIRLRDNIIADIVSGKTVIVLPNDFTLTFEMLHTELEWPYDRFVDLAEVHAGSMARDEALLIAFHADKARVVTAGGLVLSDAELLRTHTFTWDSYLSDEVCSRCGNFKKNCLPSEQHRTIPCIDAALLQPLW